MSDGKEGGGGGGGGKERGEGGFGECIEYYGVLMCWMRVD